MLSGNDPAHPEWFGAGDLQPHWRTFVHELSDRGYRNHMVGKYGIDNHNRTYDRNQWRPSIQPKTVKPSDHKLGPLARGFDSFYGFYGSAHNHFSKVIDYNGVLDWHLFNETHIIDAPQLDVEPDLHSTQIFTREAIDRLSQHIGDDKQPFFLYLSYSAPHDPLLVEPKYIGDEYPHCRDKVHHRRKLFCGMVAAVDEGIGNITSFMQSNGLMDNTIIIFSSDNGGFPMVGGFNYPYRGAKGALFDGGMRTPAFIYAPFYFKQTSKSVYDGLIHIVDWGTTLLSIVDQMNGKSQTTHSMGDIDGIDLSAILRSKNFQNENANTRTDVILNANGWTNSTSFIDGDYKLVLGYNGGNVLWEEPVDQWTRYPMVRWEMRIPDLWNRLVQFMLGPDYWFFEWSFIAVSGRVQDYFRYPHVCNSPIMRHPDGFAKSMIDRRPLWIPIALYDWDDPYSQCLIRLYNLKEDISESNNIAYENKEKVEEMLRVLNGKLMKDQGMLDLTSALQYNIYQTYKKGVIIMGSIVLVMCCSMLIVLCKCYSMLCGSSKRKAKRKKE